MSPVTFAPTPNASSALILPPFTLPSSGIAGTFGPKTVLRLQHCGCGWQHPSHVSLLRSVAMSLCLCHSRRSSIVLVGILLPWPPLPCRQLFSLHMHHRVLWRDSFQSSAARCSRVLRRMPCAQSARACLITCSIWTSSASFVFCSMCIEEACLSRCAKVSPQPSNGCVSPRYRAWHSRYFLFSEVMLHSCFFFVSARSLHSASHSMPSSQSALSFSTLFPPSLKYASWPASCRQLSVLSSVPSLF